MRRLLRGVVEVPIVLLMLVGLAFVGVGQIAMRGTRRL